MFAGADADNLLDRLDPNLAVSNGTAILETARQRARNQREIRKPRARPSRLAPEQLAGSVAEVGSSDDALVAVDTQAREGIEEAQVAAAE